MGEILMKKVGVLLLIVLVFGVIVVLSFGVDVYFEKVEQKYIVYWDGLVDLKFIMIFYGFLDMLNSIKEGILKVGLENVIEMFVNQRVQFFLQFGMNLVNVLGIVKGYDFDGFLIIEIMGKVFDFVKYYFYDGIWEIEFDVFCIFQILQVDFIFLNRMFDFEDYYLIVFLEDVEIVSILLDYLRELGKSYVLINVDVYGNEIIVDVCMYFDENIIKDDFQKFYSDFQLFIIQYCGRFGQEGNYLVWSLKIEINIMIGKEEIVIDILMEYIVLEDYVNYFKFMVMYQGEDVIIQLIYQNNFFVFQ